MVVLPIPIHPAMEHGLVSEGTEVHGCTTFRLDKFHAIRLDY